MVYDDTFSITVNGQHRRVLKGLTIADLARLIDKAGNGGGPTS